MSDSLGHHSFLAFDHKWNWPILVVIFERTKLSLGVKFAFWFFFEKEKIFWIQSFYTTCLFLFINMSFRIRKIHRDYLIAPFSRKQTQKPLIEKSSFLKAASALSRTQQKTLNSSHWNFLMYRTNENNAPRKLNCATTRCKNSIYLNPT